MATAKDDKGKTANKPRTKPVMGPGTGPPFSAENQPSSEAKKAGWAEKKKLRLLTTEIQKKLIGEDNQPTKDMGDFVKSLFNNAAKGNPKAIDVIANCIEDSVAKVSLTDGEGNPVTIFQIPDNNRDARS